MGHVLDLVPNHMGIANSANPWWQDVLENGPSSRFARFFDIEWHPVKDELANKVLIPTLGDQYGAVLERQELRVSYRDGAFAVDYGTDATFPLAPDTYPAILGLDLEALKGRASSAEADELQSIITAALNLPPRTTRRRRRRLRPGRGKRKSSSAAWPRWPRRAGRCGTISTAWSPASTARRVSRAASTCSIGC